MDWLRSRIARNPRQALLVGKVLFLAGSILILGAVFARAALMNLNAGRTDAKLPLLHTLAQAYPQYPTWIVPEGPVGYAVAALLVLVGMTLTVLADKAMKGREVTVVPAEAGTQGVQKGPRAALSSFPALWIPACAGMTSFFAVG